jgi:phage major head subunit gpT-like protein
MALITSGTFSKAIWPGVEAWYGKAYDEFPVEFMDLFTKYESHKQYEEDVQISSFGLAAVKPEGQTVQYDTEQQGFITRYTHIVYGLGFQVTREAFEDDQYDVIAQKRAKELAFSMRQTKEIVGANVYNRAFNSSYTGGDTVSMVNSAHPNAVGGTWSNTLVVNANLSEAALEQACIDIARFTNDRGLKIAVLPEKIIIPPELMFEAERIVKSQYRVGTSNNDVSALVSMGKFPGGVKVNHYLTSATAWFVLTKMQNGMKYLERRGDEFEEDNSFDNDTALFKATGRYAFGWTDARAVYGAQGF